MSDPIRDALVELLRTCDASKHVPFRELEMAIAAARAALAEQPSVREPLSEDRIGELEHAAWSESEETDWSAVLMFARMVEAAHGIGVKGEA